MAAPEGNPTSTELLELANQSYAERAFDQTGLQKVQNAADLYEQLANQEVTANLKAMYLVLQSKALGFIGYAQPSKALKIEKYIKGAEVARQASQLFGISDVSSITWEEAEALPKQLSQEDLSTLCYALYFRAIHIGQWGIEQGAVESLGKWPEVRDSVQLVINLKLTHIDDYGPSRVLGYGYFKVPSLYGGSAVKANKLLSQAVNKTLVPSKNYSRNGINNCCYAEVLEAINEKQKARTILQEFIAAMDANAADVNPNYIPENQQAQIQAASLLQGMI